MLRRTLLCAVSLALSLSVVGVASAETPTPTPDPTPPPVAQNSTGSNGVAQNNGGLLGNIGSGSNILSPTVTETTTPTPTSTTTSTPTSTTTSPPTTTVTTTPSPTPRNCGIGAHWVPRLNRCVLNLGRLEGRVIILDGGPRLDICGGDTTYAAFVGRHGAFRDRIDGILGQFPDRRFIDLRRTTCTNTTVIDNGDCRTLITRQTTVLNEYRDVVRRWNDGVRVFRVDRRGDLDRVYQDRLRLRGDFDRVRTQRTTVCRDNGGDVINNITVVPPPPNYTLPAPVVLAPAPAPVFSGGQVSSIPSGSVATGNGDGPGLLDAIEAWLDEVIWG